MSSGNNKQVLYFPYGCTGSSGTIGYWHGKEWSGGNDPKRVVPQNYTMSRVGTLPGPIRWRRPTDPPNKWQQGNFLHCYGGVVTKITIPSDMEQRLINRLKAQVRGHDFNAGVSLGEANESLRMIKDRAGKIARALDSDSGYLWHKTKKFIPAAAWLEAVYGWLPLMSDVKSGAEALASHLNRPRKQRYRASLTVQGHFNSSSPTNWIAGGRCVTSFRALAILREDPSLVASLELDDPLSVAWELVPYSFVADWFIPIGGWLSARNFLAKTQAQYVITRLDIRDGRCVKFIGQDIVQGFGSYRLRTTSFSRKVGVPSLPLPRFKPLSGVLSNWRHAVDSLALLDAKFRFSIPRIK